MSGTPTTSSDASLLSSSTETPQSLQSPTTGKSGTIAEGKEGGHSETSPSKPWEGDLDVLKTELGFTIPLLMKFPKCYWIWNYRLWTLNQAIERLPRPMATKVWEEELGLVGKMLNKDQRNFHAWGYRRYVVERLESKQLANKSLVEPEFEYTTRMINQNLSNFSAWHHRSQLIPRVLQERQADDDSRRKFLEAGMSIKLTVSRVKY